MEKTGKYLCITKSFGNVCNIVYKTENIQILFTNHRLVMEMAQHHNHGKDHEFCEMFSKAEMLEPSRSIYSNPSLSQHLLYCGICISHECSGTTPPSDCLHSTCLRVIFKLSTLAKKKLKCHEFWLSYL